MISQFGPYRLDRLLGEGGMGEVYRAWDETRGRWVAVKILKNAARDDDLRRRFRQEAEIVGGLLEPHVIPVHDFGVIDDRLFIDMRLVEGPDLASELRRIGRLGGDRTVRLLRQVAAALDAAHAAGIVHRDVKPSNVLVGEGDFAYVVDFGIARRGRSPMTDAAVIAGTVGYLAPERLRGEPAGAPGDVYSLGCVLHECLTGHRPFCADDVAELIAAHLEQAPPRPGDRYRDVRAFDPVVARAMAKDPESRYPSCTAMTEAMIEALAGSMPVTGSAPGSRDALKGATSRRWTKLITGQWEPRREATASKAPRSNARRSKGPVFPPLLGSTRLRSVAFGAALVLLVVLVAVIGDRYTGGGLPVGLGPVAVAASSDGSSVVVIDAGSPRATVVDARRRTVRGAVPLGATAVGAVAAPGSDRLYVITTAGRRRNDLVTLDLRTGAVLDSLPLIDRGDGRPAIDARERRLLVPSEGGVQVVDLQQGRILRELPDRARLVAAPDGGALAVTAADASSALRVWDTDSGAIVGDVAVGTEVAGLLAAGEGRLYVAGTDPERAVTEVDLRSRRVSSTIPLPAGAAALTLSPDHRRLFVAVVASPPWLADVDVDSRAVRARYFLEPYTGATALATAPSGSAIYIANTDLGTLTIDDVAAG